MLRREDYNLKRGGYVLAHQSQVVQRDLKAEEIARSFGATAMGFYVEEDQITDRNPYRFLVYSPTSAALAWTAFYREEDLRCFCEAYGITIEGELKPGERFTLRLPQDAKAFKPLVGM